MIYNFCPGFGTWLATAVTKKQIMEAFSPSLNMHKRAQRERLKKIARVRMRLKSYHLLIFALVVMMLFGALMKSIS